MMCSTAGKRMQCAAVHLMMLVAAVVLLMCLRPATARAAAATGFQFEEDGLGGICITGMDGEMPSALVVPSEIDGLPVRSIGPHAFRLAEELVSVVLPDGLEEIGEGAFYGCSALGSVELPQSLTNIGDEAFAHCDALLTITLPEGLTALGDAAFWHCSSLAEVSVPDTLTVLPEGAFGYCSALSSIALNDTLTEIGPQAFAGTGLVHLEMPDSVESLGNAVLNACPFLQSLEISSGVVRIPEEMVSDCSVLAEVILPPTVQAIGVQAFAHCEALAALQLPSRLEFIGEKAFWGCASLLSIEVPDGVQVIPQGAFWDCSSLEEITLPAGLRSIGGMAFYGTHLENVYFAGTEAQWNAIKVDGPGWTQTGAELENSNAVLEQAQVHFEGDAAQLPAGVRIRAYSRLWIDKTPDLGTLLRGATLENAPGGITSANLLGQFVIPDTVDPHIISADGQGVPEDGSVGTGDTLTMTEQGARSFDAQVVVGGDVLGTGQMSLSQVVCMAAAYGGERPLSGVFLLAGDFTGSGQIDLTDVVREAQLFQASMAAV